MRTPNPAGDRLLIKVYHEDRQRKLLTRPVKVSHLNRVRFVVNSANRNYMSYELQHMRQTKYLEESSDFSSQYCIQIGFGRSACHLLRSSKRKSISTHK